LERESRGPESRGPEFLSTHAGRKAAAGPRRWDGPNDRFGIQEVVLVSWDSWDPWVPQE
jgi:hypothetical protein